MSDIQPVPPEEVDTPDDVNHGDAMSPDNVGQVQAITLMRIYDVLMAQFMDSNEQAAEKLLELHVTGAFLGPSPSLSGVFVYDQENLGSTGDQENSEPEG